MATIEQKAKAYDEALERAKKELQACGSSDCDAARQIFRFFPELVESKDEMIRKNLIELLLDTPSQDIISHHLGLNEVLAWLEKQGQVKESLISQHENKICKENDDFLTSEDERIRKGLIDTFSIYYKDEPDAEWDGKPVKDILAWLKRQGDLKPAMIQWNGENLREVIDFTGKDKNFDKWFTSFEEYEKYVHEHNNIFKLFNEDGSHYEVPVGAWIVKTPDGYNAASKAGFKPRSVGWSEEDKKKLSDILAILRGGENCYYNSPILIDWLKSLKDRYTWKPSESDIRILEQVIDGTANPINYHATLHAILEKLKKLREE